jgi:hypothetical protein
MTKVFYHGTNADNLKSILDCGLSCNENKLWNVSNDYVYMWSADKMREAWDCENDEECETRAFQMAFESAQISCAFANDCRCVVFRIELNEDEVYEDDSSENMAGQGAVYIDRCIELHEITEIKVSNDLSLVKAYFMAIAANNEYSNIELTRIEKRIVDAMAKAEIYPDDIEDMTEWETIKELNALLK